ncbi:PBSX family phage terminase large subunit [Levilactobacillus brevis]
MQVKQFEFAPFSEKQLNVLNWWLDPRIFEADNSELAMVLHPEWLNRRDVETIICDGSVRAGKTLIMSMSYVLWSMTNYNEEQFGIAGKTIGSLRRNVIRPLMRMLRGRGYEVKDKRADNLLVISHNGVTNYYYLFGGKDEGSQDLVQGITVAGFFFDEVALMPESFVNQATARASVDGAKFWFNCNPAGPYHWFKLEWLDQLDQHKAIHIHFTMKDNPSLSPETIDRYERMYTGVFYQRFILGQWVLSDGIIYDNFNKDKMVVKNPQGTARKYAVSIDYGTLNPTVFLMWGLYGDTWHLTKMYYYDGRHKHKQKTDEEYSAELDKFEDGLNPVEIIDPSAASFITLRRRGGHHVIKADNDVLDGIRKTGMAMNTGKIVFAPELADLFKEFASYVWDEKAAEHGEDKPVKQHDHAMDAMRYFVMYMIGRQPTIQTFKLG